MRIGYDDTDSLLTYPHVNNLSVHGQPIRMHRLYREAWAMTTSEHFRVSPRRLLARIPLK